MEASEAGLPLADFCRRRWPSYSNADWQDLFSRGGLLLNGIVASPDIPTRAGDRLECSVIIGAEPLVSSDYSIIYRDESLAVIDKPGNLPCHPAGRYYDNTLLQLLKKHEGWKDLHLANRIDRETSGLVLVALNAENASLLGKAFMQHKVHRTYLALVEGIFPEGTRKVSGWLYLAKGITVRCKRVFVPQKTCQTTKARKVETVFKRIACQNGLSWLEVVPLTGRPHQIRATLKGMGFPIVGDKLYGLDETIYARLTTDSITESDRRKLRIDRQALHAFRMELTHPQTGRKLLFKAPLPQDLLRFWPENIELP